LPHWRLIAGTRERRVFFTGTGQQDHWHLIEMLGQMGSGLQNAHLGRWQIGRQRPTGLELLPDAPVAIADKAFPLHVANEHKGPVLQIAAARRVDTRVDNFPERFFGNGIGLQPPDRPHRVHRLKNPQFCHT
jgi:hypothetical protein